MIGVAALGIYAAVFAYSAVSAAHDNWVFDQSLKNNSYSGSSSGGKAGVLTLGLQPRGGAARSQESAVSASMSSGSAVGRLQIPSIGLSEMVLEGTGEWILQRGAGHIAGTDYPGGEGNIGIAGHRDRSFRKLKNISKHDKIVLQTLHGTYVYRVNGISIVDPADVDVLGRTPQPTLTLVTCYPFYFIGSAPKRYIVKAQLVSPRIRHRAHRGDMAAKERESTRI